MAWRYLARAVETGVVIDPRDFVMNQTEFAAEFNGLLDRDNIATAGLVAADFEAATFVEARYDNALGAPLQTIDAGAGGSWVEITDVTTSFTVDDGELIVDADINVEWPATAVPTNNKWEARLLINGNAVAHTGWGHQVRLKGAQALTGSCSVSAGTATVAINVRAWADPWTELDAYDSGNMADVEAAFMLNPMYTTFDLDILAANLAIIHRKH